MDSFDQDTGEIVGRDLEIVPARASSQDERNLVFASPICDEIFGALAEAQGQMGNPKKTKSAKVQGTTKGGASYSYDYKYAPLEEVVDVIREPLSRMKLIYRQFLAQREGNWVMRTVIAHVSGQWFGCDYPVFADRPGAQGFASGVTYARRYGLMLALGLVGEDDDDATVADGLLAKIEGRPAQQSARAQQAAPAASTDLAEARRQHGELRGAIDAAETVEDVDRILSSKDWERWHEIGVAAMPTNHPPVEAALRDRALKRKDMLGEEYQT